MVKLRTEKIFHSRASFQDTEDTVILCIQRMLKEDGLQLEDFLLHYSSGTKTYQELLFLIFLEILQLG